MIFDKAFRSITNSGEILTLDNPDGWATGTLIGSSRSAFMKLSAVNVCVELLSNSMSKLPIFIMDSKTKKHKDDHPLLRVLTHRPNEAMTPSVYKKLMEVNRLTKGNAYALIIRDKKSAFPKELIPLPSDYVIPNIDDNGVLWYVFVNPKTGEKRKFHNADIIHYKAYSEDGINGISVLSRAREVVSTAKAAQLYENKFYSQNARVSGVLTVDSELKKDNKDKIRKEWANIHSGADNAFRIAVLDIGLKYQPIGISNADAQFVESRNLTVEDIARFFGVPLYKLNAGKQSYKSNEQNAIEYLSNSVHPTVTQCEEEDTYKLLFTSEINNGLQIRRNIMAELRTDFNTRAVWYTNMRNNGGFSVNDIRRLEDMPEVVGGETHNASVNFVPLEDFREISKARNLKGGK